MILNKAIEAMSLSYSPYSKFKVGAAIKLKNGKYIMGANVENVSYSLSMCAERVAIYKMISEGYTKDDIIEMAVVADTKAPIAPCGACRQVMLELLNKDTKIILSNLNNDVKEVTVGDLIPYGFEELE